MPAANRKRLTKPLPPHDGRSASHHALVKRYMEVLKANIARLTEAEAEWRVVLAKIQAERLVCEQELSRMETCGKGPV